MEQMIDAVDPTIDEPAQFYDRLAVDYDMMTGFDKRFVHERPFFNLLVNRYKIATALDAGAGTGFHSLLLAQLGVEVTAIDVSKKMLEGVKAHAKQLHMKIAAVESSFQELPNRVQKKFDAVVCLGNSLAHLLTHKDLQRSVDNFSSVLNPGGLLFLQMLNYERILATKEKVQSVKEVGDLTFIRSYEYGKEFLTFTILTLKKEKGNIKQESESVKLRPILKDELVSVLEQAGFTDIRIHGSVAFDDFQGQLSKDVVVLARKGMKPQKRQRSSSTLS